MPRRILDSHIHLWPANATSPTSHAWMTPGHFLAQRHGIDEYNAVVAPASTSSPPDDFIYVETDSYLPTPAPNLSATEQDEAVVKRELQSWARAPVDELCFLRRIIEGTPADDGSDGFSPPSASRMRGLVIWAPFHLSPRIFNAYLGLARETLGERAWTKVVGFRYLLQGRGAKFVKEMAASGDFMANVMGIKGKVFDVGVDCHRDGVEVLEYVGELVRRVGESGPRFVLDHLCKPQISPSPTHPSFPTYAAHIRTLATYPSVSIKLSGAFNEFTLAPTPSSLPSLIAALKPYLDLAFDAFGPQRCIWGSDWPVCDVGGPVGRKGNWGLWRDVVGAWLDGRGVRDEEGEGGEWIWWRAGWEVYMLEGRGSAV